MRQESILILSGLSTTTTTGAAKDSSQLVNMTFQGYSTVADGDGTLKIQASNDPVPSGAMRSQFTPTNWVDIPNASASITSGGSALIILSNVAIGWVRAVYTKGVDGTGTYKVNMNGVGA